MLERPAAQKLTARSHVIYPPQHFDPKGQKIVTQIEERRAEDFVEVSRPWFQGGPFVSSLKLGTFFSQADDYHQKYLINNPSGYQCSTHRLWW